MLHTLAQYRMYNDHMDDGWGWGMAALMVLAVVVIVGLVVWLVRSAGTHHPVSAAPPTASALETPIQILDRRLAQGEITPAEHQERAAILANPPPAPSA